MNKRPRVLVFAAGSATGGGSGFVKMVELSHGYNSILDADIVGVVSNHSDGGVARKARELGVRFAHWAGPFISEGYQHWVTVFRADYVMLSGWLKKFSGLEMAWTINIHPGPLPLTRGLYGHYVHEAVLAAYHRGEITMSAVNIHFVDEEYDTGPVAFSVEVPINPDDTPETLGTRVNAYEHIWQSRILNLIVHGRIWLNGRTVHSEGVHFCHD